MDCMTYPAAGQLLLGLLGPNSGVHKDEIPNSFPRPSGVITRETPGLGKGWGIFVDI